MRCAMTRQTIRSENQRFAETGGISRNNRSLGFHPGFYDAESGEMDISRFAGGMPAPIHLLDGVPMAWVVRRDASGQVVAIKDSVISGFILDGQFFTRKQTADLAAQVRLSA
jgi:hypothetical protein